MCTKRCLLYESGSLCCSRKAENSTRRSLVVPMDRPSKRLLPRQILGGLKLQYPRRRRGLLWCEQSVWEFWEHDSYLFHQSVLLWETSSRKSRDGVCEVREWSIRVPNKPLANVWIYDQLHPQAQTPTREIYDEQCFGKLHHIIGGNKQGYTRNSALHGLCIWSLE